jgi:hypothetical protein
MRTFYLLLLFAASQTSFSQSFEEATLPNIHVSEDLISALNNTSTILKDKILYKKSFKIQFYGQSIVQGISPDRFKEKLENRYPKVDFEVLNNAIGSYQAPKLLRTADYDLYPEYPDLLIFHVYGGIVDGALEELFINIKDRLDSDVVIFDHHLAFRETEKGQQKFTKHHDVNSIAIKELALKYNFGFIGVRDYWKEYLKLNPELNIKDLLRDHIHPNEDGKALLEWIIFESIVKAVKENNSIINNRIKKPITEDQLFKFEMSGNRLDFIPSPGNVGAKISVNVDGKPIEETVGLYAVTRPSGIPGQWWPPFNKIFLNPDYKHLEEKWKIVLSNLDLQNKTYDFSLIGETSGFQGKGNSTQNFTSDNGQFQIEITDHSIFPLLKKLDQNQLEGFEINFKVYPLYNDLIEVIDTNPITLFMLSDNKSHKVTIKALNGTLRDSSLIIYDPSKR